MLENGEFLVEVAGQEREERDHGQNNVRDEGIGAGTEGGCKAVWSQYGEGGAKGSWFTSNQQRLLAHCPAARSWRSCPKRWLSFGGRPALRLAENPLCSHLDAAFWRAEQSVVAEGDVCLKHGRTIKLGAVACEDPTSSDA